MKRLCVLTGASGLLGTAFVKRCRERFQIVAVHCNHELDVSTQHQSFIDPLDLSKPLQENENPVFAIRADLSSERAIDTLCTEVIERFHRIDLLVNAAGHRHWCGLLRPSGLDDAEQSFLVNVLAPVRLAIGFAKHFWCTRVDENIQLRRHVVNVSSTAGVYVYPDLGQALYASSKAALNHVTYHLASELWDIGVRVNAVAPNSFPGRITTDTVLDQIVAFDLSDDTGRLTILDE